MKMGTSNGQSDGKGSVEATGGDEGWGQTRVRETSTFLNLPSILTKLDSNSKGMPAEETLRGEAAFDDRPNPNKDLKVDEHV